MAVLVVSAVMVPVEPEVLLEQAVTEKAEPVVLVELQKVVLLAVTPMRMAVPVLVVPVTAQAVLVMVPEVSEALVRQDMVMRRRLACIGHEVLVQALLLVFVPAERLVPDSICL